MNTSSGRIQDRNAMQNRSSLNQESPLCGDDIRIRRMRPGDIAAGMRLKSIAGWNQTDRDWKLFLDVNSDGCFVAVCAGGVVGTVTTIIYENRIAWIGMMLVDPAYRRRGIATRLINHAVAWLGPDITVKLDATPLGKTVYDRLGFVEEYTLCRISADSVATDTVHPTGISPVSSADLEALISLDRTAFGAGRSTVLESLFRNSSGLAWKCSRDGLLTGYCMGRPGTDFRQIGPVIAAGTDDAVGLALTALNGIAGQAAVIDAPAGRDDFLRRLYSCGFVEQRRLIRMYRGNNDNPGKPDMVFAIAGPELG